MKLLSSILLVLSVTAHIADARRASTSSLASVPRRGDLRKQRVAFVKSDVSASSWTNDAKEVRGGEQGGGTSSMSNHMFNMVKAVVGVGVLSLPAGELVLHRNMLETSQDDVVISLMMSEAQGKIMSMINEIKNT